MTTSDHSPAVCEVCQEPGRVSILCDYEQAKPVFRHFCLAHAEEFHPFSGVTEEGGRPQRLSLGSLFVLVGLLLGMIGVVGQWVGIGSSPGVGWLQLFAMGGGALFVLLGALIGIDAVEVIGAVVFGLGAGADLIGGEGVSSFGWQQQLVLGGGIVLAGIGIGLRLGFGLQSTGKGGRDRGKGSDEQVVSHGADAS